MFKLRTIPVLLGAITCASCQMYSAEPLRTLTYPVPYAPLADCTYLKLDSEQSWRKEDMSSMSTSRLIRGGGEAHVDRLEFIGTGPASTKVEMRHQVRGGPDRYQPFVDACAAGLK